MTTTTGTAPLRPVRVWIENRFDFGGSFVVYIYIIVRILSCPPIGVSCRHPSATCSRRAPPAAAAGSINIF